MLRVITIMLFIISFSSFAKSKQFVYKVAEGCSALDKKIPDESSTEISCKCQEENPLTHYYIWLPKGYNEQASDKRPYSFLVIDNANGTSQKKLKNFRDWAAANKCILLMPVEISNNGKDNYKHYHNMIVDAKNRLHLGLASGVFTGCSGGGRRATVCSANYYDLCGGVLHAAGIVSSGGLPFMKRRHIFSASVLGDHDYNINEMYTVSRAMKKRGYYRIIELGHGWYPKEDGELALDWLAWKMASRKSPKLNEHIVKDIIFSNHAKIDTAHAVLKNQYMLHILEIFKIHSTLKKDKEMGELYNTVSKAQAALLKDKEFKKEWKAMLEYEKDYQKYCIEGFTKSLSSFSGSITSASLKPKVIKATQRAREKIVKEMAKIVTEYPDSYAAGLAQKEIDRLENFESHWGK